MENETKKKPRGPVTRDEMTRLGKLYMSGMTLRTIAATTGRAYSTVWLAVQRSEAQMRPRGYAPKADKEKKTK